MTPPLTPVKGPSAPPKLPPLPDPTPIQQPAPAVSDSGKSSYVALKGDSDAFKSKEDLVAALSDERLFGGALKDYQAGKDGKYLRVNLALDAVRSGIAEAKSGSSAQRIEMWLNTYELLTDTAVAHVARVNLLKALKKAPKDLAEIAKPMIEALEKQYNPAPPKKEEAPATKEAPAKKDAPTFLAQLEDDKLFGDQLKDYEAKKNKEYVTVQLALAEIRKLTAGKTKDVEPVKLRIEKWLGDSVLLTDKVPHKARVNLIKALEAAPSSEAIATIISALKANYGKAGSAKKEEAPPAPSEVKTKSEGSTTSYSTKPNAKLKSQREDTPASFQNGMNAAIRPIFQRYLKSNASGLSAEMTVTIDEKTGAITDVSFANVKAQAGEETLKNFFRDVANALRGRFLFKSGIGQGDFGFIKANVKFVAQ